jgi:NAD(P)-dependent dehydrogenase (short-subunit alcohol dehydrogenase family)
LEGDLEKMNFKVNLSEKVAIVTGGNQGIGFALAQGLAKCGAKVVIANRRAAEGEAAAQAIRKAGGSATSIPTDVSQKKSVERMVEKILQDYERIDILVNNAGVNVRKSAIEVTEENLDMIFDTNLKGLFFCCQVVGHQMIQQRRGKIVNVASIVATFGFLNRAPYCASKAGVSQLTRVLALEWAEYGVYVNAIGPGIIQTPLTEAYMKSDPKRLERVLQKVPSGRLGKPEDLVGVTLFLASEASDYMTGQTLYIDGGYSLGCMDW